ncbi:MAG: hypothetical protein D3909_14605 [Candidatus Electrothrix sp. ATG1]|nr:hypothetical protein [Candidatus Electrothrix sp. ATG1]
MPTTNKRKSFIACSRVLFLSVVAKFRKRLFQYFFRQSLTGGIMMNINEKKVKKSFRRSSTCLFREFLQALQTLSVCFSTILDPEYTKPAMNW